MADCETGLLESSINPWCSEHWDFSCNSGGFFCGFFVGKTFGCYLETIVSVHNVEISLIGTGLIAQADLSKRLEEI